MSEVSPRVTAFLGALPRAKDEEFVAMPGLATYRARHVRRGLERGVIAIHSTGYGFALQVPPGHVGLCPTCAVHKGSICTHCGCALCVWEHQVAELGSPFVSREKFVELARRLQAFRLAGPPSRSSASLLDGDL